MCLVSALVLAAALHLTHSSLDLESWVVVLCGVSFLACVHFVYARVRPDPLIATAAGGLAVLLWTVSMAGIIALAGLRAGAPLIDGRLAGMDAALGLDIRGLVAWTARHPVAGWVLKVAYASTVPAVLVTTLGLACTRHPQRMWELCFLFAASATLCTAATAFIPAVGAFVHYGIPASVVAELPPGAGIYHMGTFNAFRSGSVSVIGSYHLDGVVVFPSFHAAMAATTAFAMRGLRGVSAVAWTWCGAVLVSTIPIGGHYGVDIIAGLSLCGALAFMTRFLGPCGARTGR